MAAVQPGTGDRPTPGPFQYKAFLSYSHAVDGQLAGILQARLQGLAKPWYQRRAIRVFRDTTGLGVTPDLWEAVRAALLGSEYFVLLASERAAASQWVALEVDAWLAERSPDHLLIAWTDGELHWDTAAGDFDWARSTCLPSRLRSAFRAEPLHLDLRWARTTGDLSRRRPEFLEAVARLSATLRGRPVDDLIGEDVRQHRRTRRLAGAAVAMLAVLLLAAVVTAVLAVQQRNLARERGRIAEEQREESRQRLVRLLVSNGVRQMDERDLSGSALWFAEALRTDAPDPESQTLQRVRLRSAVDQHPRLLRAWPTESLFGDRRIVWIAFSRDGRRLVATFETLDVREEPKLGAWDVETGLPVALTVPATERLLAVDLSIGEGRLVTGDEGGTVRLREPSTGAEIGRLVHPAEATAAELGPDGLSLLTVCDDRVVRLWDSRSGMLRATFRHGAPVVAASLALDRRRVLSTTADNAAHVWTLDGGAHVRLPHEERVVSVEVSRDGRRVLTVDASREARLWDAKSGEHLSSPASGVNHLELSPDGSQAVLASFTAAEIWNLERDDDRPTRILNHGGFVLHAAWSPDGTRLATAGTDRIARVWHVESGALVGATLHHEDTVSRISWSPDRRRLATVTATGIVRVWDLDTRPVAYRHEQHGVGSAAFHPDGRHLLTVGEREVRLWDLDAGTSRTLRVDAQIHHAAMSADGRWVVTAGEDGIARVWDATTGAEVLSLRHGRRVKHASFRPGSRQLITAGQDAGRGQVTLWDLATGEAVWSLPHESPVTYAEFARDGLRLVTVQFGGTAQVWDLERPRPVAVLVRPDVSSATLGPDGALAVIEGGSTIVVYDGTSGQPRFPGIKYRELMRGAPLAFAPDGRSLAVGGPFARVWDAARGTPRTPPLADGAGDDGPISHVQFSPDGRLIVTAGSDHARVWDAFSGQPLTPRLEHRYVRHAAFSRDGSRLVTAGGNIAQVWELSASVSTESDARLSTLAQVLAARRIDSTGAVVPLDARELLDAWKELGAGTEIASPVPSRQQGVGR